MIFALCSWLESPGDLSPRLDYPNLTINSSKGVPVRKKRRLKERSTQAFHDLSSHSTPGFSKDKAPDFCLSWSIKNTVKHDSRENHFCNRTMTPPLKLYLICRLVILFPVSSDLIRDTQLHISKDSLGYSSSDTYPKAEFSLSHSRSQVCAKTAHRVHPLQP